MGGYVKRGLSTLISPQVTESSKVNIWYGIGNLFIIRGEGWLG